MRKFIFRSSVLLSVCAFLVLSSFSCEDESCDMVFTTEDSLNLLGHEVSLDTAKAETTRFRVNVMTTDSLPKEIDSLKSDSFCKLREEANNLISQSNCSNNLITGIQIHYGLSVDNKKVILFYQPVVMCRQSFNNTTKVACYSVYRGNGAFFVYQHSTNSFVTAVGPQAAIDRYAANVQIVHFSGDIRKPHRASVGVKDTLGDVKSVFLPFREIRDLIKDNENCQYVKFWNTFVSLPYRSSQSVRKHSLLIGPSALNANKELIKTPKFYSFASKFANRANLCPPDCDEVCYTLVPQ